MKLYRRSCALAFPLLLWAGVTIAGRPEAQPHQVPLTHETNGLALHGARSSGISPEMAPGARFQRMEELERRLTDYLNGRVLVFREVGLEGDRLEFDRSGRPRGSLSEGQDRRAIRFLELAILERRLILRAEEVWPEVQNGKRIYVRRGEVIPVVRCVAALPEDPTFLSLISLLARIFLTADELDSPTIGEP